MNTRLIKLGFIIIVVFAGLYFFLVLVTSQDPERRIPGGDLNSSSITSPDSSASGAVKIPDSKPAQSAAFAHIKPEKETYPDADSFSEKDQNATATNSAFVELDKKYGSLETAEVMKLLSSQLPDVDRNYLEQMLAESRDEEVDERVEEMIDDGFMDLSLDGEELTGEEAEDFLDAATRRMNSAIRIAGLRGQKSSVANIIDIASHYNAPEETTRVCYEALGYLGTKAASDYLSIQLQEQKNPFLKSEIVLSLSTTGNTKNVNLYLSYLDSRDTDLRNSAIIALGEAGEERAVAPFGRIFDSTEASSRVLMVQALKKIDSLSSQNLLEKISKSYPNLVTPSLTKEGEL